LYIYKKRWDSHVLKIKRKNNLMVLLGLYKKTSIIKSLLLLIRYAYLDLTEVELKLLTLKNVTIATTRLTGTRRDDGIETTGVELIVQKRINSGSGGTGSQLLFNAVGLLFSLLLLYLLMNIPIYIIYIHIFIVLTAAASPAFFLPRAMA
jgi:hypothetical protein